LCLIHLEEAYTGGLQVSGGRLKALRRAFALVNPR
jgi:hypothetical protein